MRKNIILILFTILLSPALYAETPAKGYSFGIRAGFSAPLGYYSQKLNSGPGFGISGARSFGWKNLFLDADIVYNNYQYTPQPGSSFSQISASVGPVFFIEVHPLFIPLLGISGGVNYSMLTINSADGDIQGSAWKPFAKLKTGFLVHPFDRFGFKVEAEYTVHELTGKVFQNFGIYGSVVYRMGSIF